jgi:hypothetical protein
MRPRFQVPVEDTAKVARNAELEALIAAMDEARALTARAEDAAGGATPLDEPSTEGPSRETAAAAAEEEEQEGELGLVVAGDLEDDFILAVLDADALPAAGRGAGGVTILEALTEDDDEGSDLTDRVRP